MKLSIGIVGLPNVGKSTLFKLLTKQEVNIANYPFATIDPNVGVVPVPDLRLQKLAAMSKSKKIVPAVVEFYDIAGLVKGANQGEGLGNQFLSHIRETNAVVVVIRAFSNSEIIHVENSVDPVRDLEIVNTELILKDLESVDRAFTKAESEAKTGKKEALAERDALLAVKEKLEAGKLLFSSEELIPLIRANKGYTGIRDMNLLTAKKQIYLFNGKEEDVPPKLKEKVKALESDYAVVDLAEAEHSNILQNVGMSALIRKAYETLNLVSFLTTGEDETRAWTIERGTKTPQAAGVIHTDFEKNFIRAEVVPYQELMAHGGWQMAKQKGKVRLEGKEYVVQDGDVLIVRHG